MTALAGLVRGKQVSSVELTKLYLERLQEVRPGPEVRRHAHRRAGAEAGRAADREIAAGRYRGPLHGIPWGAKDLIAYPGYKTTWGAAPFKDQTIDDEGDRRPDSSRRPARCWSPS